MVFWAGNFIVVKGAVGILPPVGFTFLRYLLASRHAAASCCAGARARSACRAATSSGSRCSGIVGFGCYQIIWPVALQTIPAGDSALLIATTPVLTALLAVGDRCGRRPTRSSWPVRSCRSSAWPSSSPPARASNLGVSLGGDLLTLGAAAVLGDLHRLRMRTSSRRHSPLVATTWAIVRGHAVPGARRASPSWRRPTCRGFGLPVAARDLYAGTLAAGFANVVVVQGLKMLGPTQVTAFQFLVPALAVVLAAIFLGEAIRPAPGGRRRS